MNKIKWKEIKSTNKLVLFQNIFNLLLLFLVFYVSIDINDVAALNNEDTKSITSEIIEKLEVIQEDVLIESVDSNQIMVEVELDLTPTVTKQEVGVCGINLSTKTYEAGDAITDVTSPQYALIQTMHPNEKGMYVTDDGYIGVALGSVYGAIGTKYEITLDTGIVLNVIKLDEKADKDTVSGCYHASDGSMIEFVIDVQKAMQYYGTISNEYILNGNFNNHSDYEGNIVSMKKIIE